MAKRANPHLPWHAFLAGYAGQVKMGWRAENPNPLQKKKDRLTDRSDKSNMCLPPAYLPLLMIICCPCLAVKILLKTNA